MIKRNCPVCGKPKDITITHMDYHELGESLLNINVLESEKVVTISRISWSKNS